MNVRSDSRDSHRDSPVGYGAGRTLSLEEDSLLVHAIRGTTPRLPRMAYSWRRASMGSICAARIAG